MRPVLLASAHTRTGADGMPAVLQLRPHVGVRIGRSRRVGVARTLRLMPCDSIALRRMTPRTYHRRLVHRLVNCATRRFPVRGGAATAWCIVMRESSGWPWAKNPSGSWGLVQAIPSTWASWWGNYTLVRHWILRARPHYRGDRRLDAYSNIVIGIRAMHDGLSPWGGGC